MLQILLETDTITAIPQEPYRQKTVEHETKIDLAFYIQTFLNITKNFAIYELKTSFF